MGARRWAAGTAMVVSTVLIASFGTSPTGSAAEAPSRSAVTRTSADTTLPDADRPAVDLPKAADRKKTSSSKRKKKDDYSPRRGVTFNNPLGNLDAKYRVFNAIQDAIRHAPGNSTMKIMSWNVMTRTGVTALLAAQKRGVRIRLLMDNTNLVDIPNPYFKRLRAGFKAQNKSKPMKRRSYAKTCMNSCRGIGGQAHSKFYLFSRTGKARKVVMQGSANLTAASAVNQWNDIYTWIGNKKLYNFTDAIFDQMWADTPVDPAYAFEQTKNGSLYFSPFRGSTFTEDPRLALLNQVSCTGASGAGRGGRTVIRLAPDVVRNERGMAIAQRLRELYNQGCDVKIGYTVMGVDIFRFLRAPGGRGPVPLVHLVQDFDGDKEFDNYFHLKAMTISGNVNGDPGAYWTVNGSANISGNSSASDENIGIFQSKKQTKLYENFISYWIANPPSNGRVVARSVIGPVDPYAHVDMD